MRRFVFYCCYYVCLLLLPLSRPSSSPYSRLTGKTASYRLVSILVSILKHSGWVFITTLPLYARISRSWTWLLCQKMQFMFLLRRRHHADEIILSQEHSLFRASHDPKVYNYNLTLYLLVVPILTYLATLYSLRN
jgi:hypothetical protein